jgi:D-alanyl-D-alanine carboxypeptidase/D-alanyl-D-alanine-endopeptidase (penicillin-binding protein 4)
MKLHTGLTPAQVTKLGGMNAVIDILFPPPDSPGRGGSAVTPPRGSFRIASFIPIMILLGCASLPLGGAGVERGEIERILARPPMDQMHVGVLAVDARTGRTLFSHNAQRRFIPASNQKILVTATALSLLGPDFRFRTEIRTGGEMRDGVLHGDLVLKASGDPSLSGRFWPSTEAALMAIADSVRAHGIHRIAGSLRVDVSRWDSTTVGPTWEVDDLRYAYGATGGAFTVNEGEIDVVVASGPTAGSQALVSWSPVGTDDFVRSYLRTVPADSVTRVRPSYLPESRLLELEGTVVLGAVDTLSFAIRDPVRQATAALARSLTYAGVAVDGGWEVTWNGPDEMERPGAGVLFALESPPLSDLVRAILEPSQNWMTEQMVRALGARFGIDGSWTEGIEVITWYLVNEVGVDPNDLAARDGSGLSFYNLITPRALVLILREIRSGPYGAVYRSAMAEPGEIDSTLEDRLAGLEGRVFAKTGTISNVNSLSGYLVGDSGREIVFSILTNGSGLPATTVRAAIDDVVRALSR